MAIDDEIEVFIYTDSEDRLVATTDTPIAFVDEFAFVKVVDTTPFGAFVDIGLAKDLLVPRNRQKTPFYKGDKRIIRIIEDEETNRLVGVEKIKIFLKNDTRHFKTNQKVDILVIAQTPLGFKVIVDNSYEGQLYHNEVFEDLYAGNKRSAYIKKVRDDGKLDISLVIIGKDEKAKNINVFSDIVLEQIPNNGEVLNFTYKSNADDIYDMFKMSKKNFKKTLTQLLKENKIILFEDGIKLV
jgi:predicted RNA-binding protein (virulence factor B family)